MPANYDDFPLCGRCYTAGAPVYPAPCPAAPGATRCPACGATLQPGAAHPRLCRACLDRAHPGLDRR